jgi:hypothetical protein
MPDHSLPAKVRPLVTDDPDRSLAGSKINRSHTHTHTFSLSLSLCLYGRTMKMILDTLGFDFFFSLPPFFIHHSLHLPFAFKLNPALSGQHGPAERRRGFVLAAKTGRTLGADWPIVKTSTPPPAPSICFRYQSLVILLFLGRWGQGFIKTTKKSSTLGPLD